MESHKKGICRLGVVPVRNEPKEQAEMVTQLLFGDHYTIVEESKDARWFRIRIEFDQYEGWISSNQHNEISEAYFHHLNHTEFKISTDITSTILYKKRLIQIVKGSVLPISSSELFEVNEQFAFNGSSKNLGEKLHVDFLKQTITSYMNAPYLWGGKTPFGIDCSGFTQQVFKLCGYKLKRDASQQYLQGIRVENLEEAQPGDLAFFKSEQGNITHVGIVMDTLEIYHASGYVRKDKIDEKGIFNEELSTYTHKLAGLRRIFKT
ncbi:MAG: C40 family peptidase [Cyclobacteriaceae bacterium]|nr:C40 family peptidase [Cyclobacteriaceae bacterium]